LIAACKSPPAFTVRVAALVSRAARSAAHTPSPSHARCLNSFPLGGWASSLRPMDAVRSARWLWVGAAQGKDEAVARRRVFSFSSGRKQIRELGRFASDD